MAKTQSGGHDKCTLPCEPWSWEDELARRHTKAQGLAIFAVFVVAYCIICVSLVYKGLVVYGVLR